MRRAKVIVTNVLAVILAAFFVAADDNVQVIPSQKSVLSIYSYGGAEKTRIVPETFEVGHRNQRATGSLTDVTTTPPLSTKLPAHSTTGHVRFNNSGTNGLTNGAGTNVRTGKANEISGTLPTGTQSPKDLPEPQTVTVRWDSSPDQSVVGYYLYIGDASHQYNGKQPVGNQTSAAVFVGDGAIYVAVSAYTAEGFESGLSEELVLNANTSSSATSSSSVSRSAH